MAFALSRQSEDDGVVLIDETNLASAARRTYAVKELNVGSGVLLPLLWHVIFVVDGFHRADRFAGTTVHAFIRLDVEHAVALIDAVNWALFDASLVF